MVTLLRFSKFNRLFATVAAAPTDTALHLRQELLKSPFRCSEDNPLLHTMRHEGQFYHIPSHVYQRLFTFGGCHPNFRALMKTFGESCIMVRQPALEIIHHFKNTNFDLPVNRYILYGIHGSGKMTTLVHLVHLISNEPDWILLHTGWLPKWVRSDVEVIPSTSRNGRFDIPMFSGLWLQHFKSQNSRLLSEKELRIQNTYEWSLREKTEKGEHLSALIEQGITRPKFSSDCVAAIVKECKLLAVSGQIKMAVIMNGMNSLFYQTRYRNQERKRIHANDVTALRAFRKLLNNDWNNGIVLTSVDTIAAPGNYRHSTLPRYLLTKEGFEILDPFIPVSVENYSLKEINSCLDYYIDRLFILSENCKTERGRQQLIFLSGCNPRSLEKLCGSI